MKTIIIAAAIVAAITPASAQTIDTTYSEPAVKARCSAQWGTEYDMVAYCMDKSKAGHSEFLNTVEHTKALRGIQQALAKCRAQWGDEWDMVNYCANTQISAARQIMTMTDGIPKDVGDEITSRCSAEWGNEFDMVAYCMTTRIAAWRKIN